MAKKGVKALVDIDKTKKCILEGAVIASLCAVGIYSFIVGDYTNGAWALGLAGGYVFKNGVQKATKNSS